MDAAAPSLAQLEKRASQLSEASERLAQRMASVMEARSAMVLLRRLGIFVSVAILSVSCSLSLLHIDIKLRYLKRAIQAGLERGDSRTLTLRHARRLGDISRRLFWLADQDRRLVYKMEGARLGMYVECALHTFLAWRHDQVGLFAGILPRRSH